MTAKEIVDRLKAKYRPMNSFDCMATPNDCCVGGAPFKEGLLSPVDKDVAFNVGYFPAMDTLWESLKKAGVPSARAWHCAHQIVTQNDDGNFETAWDYLEHAFEASNLVDKGGFDAVS